MASTVHGTDPLCVPVLLGEATTSRRDYGHRDIAHARMCHVPSCKQAPFGNMKKYPTVPLCEPHLEENAQRMQSNSQRIKIRGKAFNGTNICEYPECSKKPRYSPIKGGPGRVCKHHKKNGMFSIRNGQILYAIHDGHAFRSTLPSSTSSDPEGHGTTPRLSSAKDQESRTRSPAQAVRVKPNTSTFQTSKPAKTSGQKAEALKIKATATRQKTTTSDFSASRSDQTAAASRSCKPSDVTGMAPSVEIKVLRKERENALAEASATGRRPRFPSLKALEASGKLNDDGVQWMTKEMYKAEAQPRKELRERRKEAAAAEINEIPVDVSGAGTSAGEGFTGREDIRSCGSECLTPVTLERGMQSTVERLQGGARRQAPDAAELKNEAKVGVSTRGSLRKRTRDVNEEDNAMVKRKPSSPRLGEPRKKIPKRNPSTTTAGKRKDRLSKTDNSRRTGGGALKNGGVPRSG